METLAAERDRDHFEVFALARQRQLQGGGFQRQQRLFAGVVDRELGPVLALDPLVIAVLGVLELAHPPGNLRIVIGDLHALPGDVADLARQSWLNRAHGDRQIGPLARFDDPEIGGELNQRRGRGKADRQRKARSIGETAARQVLDRGRQDHAGGTGGWKWPGEIERRDLRIILLIGIDGRQPFAAIGQPQPHGHRGGPV